MVVKMKMIRWICGYARLDRKRIMVISKKAKVAPIEDKIKETRLR